MSYLDFETASFVDPYSMDIADGFFDLDDDEQRVQFETLREQQKRRQSHSKPDHLGRTEVFLPFDCDRQSFLTHVAVANNTIVACTSDLKLQIYDQSDNVPSTTLDLSRPGPGKGGRERAATLLPGDQTYKLFIDPNGRHVFIVLKSHKMIYVCLRTGDNAKPVRHLIDWAEIATTQSGVTIGDECAPISVECVGWTRNMYEATTGDVFFGTRQGAQIWTGTFDVTGPVTRKKMYTIPGERQPLTGILVQRSKDPGHARHAAIYVATPNRIYTFVGMGSVEAIMNHYGRQGGEPGEDALVDGFGQNVKDDLGDGDGDLLPLSFVEIPPQPSGSPITQLQPCIGNSLQRVCFNDNAGRGKDPNAAPVFPESFVWHSAGGILFGHLITPVSHSLHTDKFTVHSTTHLVHDVTDDRVRILSRLSPESIAGAANVSIVEGSPTKSATVKLYSGEATPFCLFMSTENGIVAMAHPSCLPWNSLNTSNATAPSQTGAALNSGPGSPVLPTTQQPSSTAGAGGDTIAAMLGNLMAKTAAVSSTTSSSPLLSGSAKPIPSSQQVKQDGGKSDESSNQSDALVGYRRGLSEAKTVASRNGCFVLPTIPSATDIANRTLSTVSFQSVKELLKQGGGAGSVADPKTGKVYLWTPLSITEVQMPKLRRMMLPLFLDAAVASTKKQQTILPLTELQLKPPPEPAQNNKDLGLSDETFDPAIKPFHAADPFGESNLMEEVVDNVAPRSGFSITSPSQSFAMAAAVAGSSTPLSNTVILTEANIYFKNGDYIAAAEKYSRCDDVPATDVIVKLTQLAPTPEIGIALEVYTCKRIRRWLEHRQFLTDNSQQIYCLCHFLALLLVDRCNLLVAKERSWALRAKEWNPLAKYHSHSIFGRARPTEALFDGPTPGQLEEFTTAAAVAADFANDVGRSALREILNVLGALGNYGPACAEGGETATSEPTKETVVKAQLTSAEQAAAKAAESGANETRKQRFVAEASLTTILLDLHEHLEFKNIQHRLLGTAHPALVTLVCAILKRLDDAMRYLLIQRSFKAATQLMLTYCSDNIIFNGLWKKNFHLLFKSFPVKLVREGLIPHGIELGLHPFDLTSAFQNYSVEDNERDLETGRQLCKDHMVVEYLLHCVEKEGNSDEAVHNLLLMELAKNGTDAQLTKFITTSKYLNNKFALRECQRKNRRSACVEVYMQLKMYRDAIKLAILSGNVALAKEKVKEIDNDAERQHLWRGIARYTVHREGGPKNSLILLGEAPSDLSMNDVLPLFPDEVMVCDFKQELIANVNRFDQSMVKTHKDIETRQSIAQAIRQDIHTQQRSVARVSCLKKCEVCKQPALSRRYIVFPSCGHVFHSNCHADNTQDLSECFLCSAQSLSTALTGSLDCVEGSRLDVQ